MSRKRVRTAAMATVTVTVTAMVTAIRLRQIQPGWLQIMQRLQQRPQQPLRKLQLMLLL